MAPLVSFAFEIAFLTIVAAAFMIQPYWRR